MKAHPVNLPFMSGITLPTAWQKKSQVNDRKFEVGPWSFRMLRRIMSQKTYQFNVFLRIGKLARVQPPTTNLLKNARLAILYIDPVQLIGTYASEIRKTWHRGGSQTLGSFIHANVDSKDEGTPNGPKNEEIIVWPLHSEWRCLEVLQYWNQTIGRDPPWSQNVAKHYFFAATQTTQTGHS